MARVIGFGGAFVRADDPKALYTWYEKHLGLNAAKGCFIFPPEGQTASIAVTFFSKASEYFPSTQPTMLNFQVDDLDAILDHLETEGVSISPKPEASPYGRFGWFTDPEGNKVELWEPMRS